MPAAQSQEQPRPESPMTVTTLSQDGMQTEQPVSNPLPILLMIIDSTDRWPNAPHQHKYTANISVTDQQKPQAPMSTQQVGLRGGEYAGCECCGCGCSEGSMTLHLKSDPDGSADDPLPGCC